MTTLANQADFDLLCIQEALAGRVFIEFSESGEPMFEQAEDIEEAHGQVLAIFDNWVYHAIKGYACARAFENMLVNHGFKLEDPELFSEYIAEMDKEEGKYDTYVPSWEREEVVQEAEEVLNETD